MVVKKAVFYSQLLTLERICSLTLKLCSHLLRCKLLCKEEILLCLETTVKPPTTQTKSKFKLHKLGL